MTTYNEEETLFRCLSAIESQTVKPSHLIIVDDGSTDRTKWYLNSYRDMVRVDDPKYAEGYKNRARAFNRGLEKARTYHPKFLMKVDADIVVPNNYAETLLYQMDPLIGVASGVSSGYKNKRFVSNGAIMYRMDPLGKAPMRYAWDRQLTLGLIRRGYNYRVVPELEYLELRPPRIGAPPLWRVVANRFELAWLKLNNRGVKV